MRLTESILRNADNYALVHGDMHYEWRDKTSTIAVKGMSHEEFIAAIVGRNRVEMHMINRLLKRPRYTPRKR